MSGTLIIASSNAHKVQELKQMLSSAALDVGVLAMHELGVPPSIEESAPDFGGNAKLKSEGIARWAAVQGVSLDAPAWVLADDSGLCVEALGGQPGVYSARYAGPDATDQDNNAKLVQELQARGLDRSPCYFCCVLALSQVAAQGPMLTHTFEGRAKGHAQVVAAGDGGFGYDPHVWIEGQSASFAQMSREAKAKISHRGLALAKLLAALPGILSGPVAG